MHGKREREHSWLVNIYGKLESINTEAAQKKRSRQLNRKRKHTHVYVYYIIRKRSNGIHSICHWWWHYIVILHSTDPHVCACVYIESNTCAKWINTACIICIRCAIVCRSLLRYFYVFSALLCCTLSCRHSIRFFFFSDFFFHFLF